MSNLGSRITYKRLLKRHGRIRIPMIQRDYAQGRPSEAEVREDFLNALGEALRKPADDPSLPLNLDFIYGSVEGDNDTRFLPLDGQQRLTTLFLLHWYLAWKDNEWAEFRSMFRANGHARFSYSVRPSSNEFFDELVAYEPDKAPAQVEQLSKLITDQSWYFRSWRLDPTIQSTLSMLDAIHHRFASTTGLFARLTSETQPAITFQLLDLNNFGLSDDLYIKMNARGKPLTPFETFKARYNHELENQFPGESLSIGDGNFSVAEFFVRRMDTVWADLFWAHRDKSTNLYDEALMNLFRVLALITRDPDSPAYLEDVAVLRNGYRPPAYSDFHSRNWLDRRFTKSLICLLEAWSGVGGVFTSQLPTTRYFEEMSMFSRVVSRPADLSYAEVVQLAAYGNYLVERGNNIKPQEFEEWMRVVLNLSVNTSYDRPADLQRSIAGLQKLTPVSGSILSHFAGSEKPTAGFSEQQVSEEKLKAELILKHTGWRPLIDRAEGHGYFRGQIEFLLDFCGILRKGKVLAIGDWNDATHLSFQQQFKDYLEKAEGMFADYGLNDLKAYRWQRALLSSGDYLLPSGRQNLSFLVNGATEQASWKRLLRGTGPKVPEARQILHALWDRLVNGQGFQGQLDSIVAGANGLEPWREAFVRSPEAIAYCGNQSIRRNSETEVYLLKKSQMNGAHAELFSYCLHQTVLLSLYKQGQLAPLILRDYQSAIGTDFVPHILLAFPYEGYNSSIKVQFNNGIFLVCIDPAALQNMPDMVASIRDSLSFVETEGHLTKEESPATVQNALLSLAHAVASAPKGPAPSSE